MEFSPSSSRSDRDYILEDLLPEWERLFQRKSNDYNDSQGFEPHTILGIQGQFGEIWRKVWKLKKAMWDGEPLTQEPPREVLLDMIGHCFLAISMLDRDAPTSGEPQFLSEATFVMDTSSGNAKPDATLFLQRELEG